MSEGEVGQFSPGYTFTLNTGHLLQEAKGCSVPALGLMPNSP